MRIYQFPIFKEQLSNIPEDERKFLIIGGHILNELNALNRLILMSLNYDETNKIEANAGAAQAMMLIRVFIGKLYEAWIFTQKRFKESLEVKYQKKLSEDGNIITASAYTKIVQYFAPAARSLIYKIRNNFSNHYYDEQELVEKIFSELPDTQPLNIYAADKNINTFYHLSEAVVGYAMLKNTGKETYEAAMDSLRDESYMLTSLLTDFIGGIIALIIEEYIGDSLEKIGATEQNVDAANVKSVKIPHFITVQGNA